MVLEEREKEGITSISKRCNFHAIMRARAERTETEMREAGKKRERHFFSLISFRDTHNSLLLK